MSEFTCLHNITSFFYNIGKLVHEKESLPFLVCTRFITFPVVVELRHQNNVARQFKNTEAKNFLFKDSLPESFFGRFLQILVAFSKYMNFNPTQILSFSGSSCERTGNWKGRCQISFVHSRYRQYCWTGCVGLCCRQTLDQSPVFVQYFLSHLWVM